MIEFDVNEEDLAAQGDCEDLEEEMRISVSIACSDLNLYQQSAIFHLLNREVQIQLENKTLVLEKNGKEKSNGLLYKSSKLNIKLEEFIRDFIRKRKAKVVETLELALDYFKKISPQPLPMLNDKMHPKFAKEIYQLLEEVSELKAHDKVKLTSFIEEFWAKKRATRERKLKRRMKKLASETCYYALDSGNSFYRKATQKLLIRILRKLWLVRWILHRTRCAEKAKAVHEGRQEVKGEDSNCGRGEEQGRECVRRCLKRRVVGKLLSCCMYRWVSGEIVEERGIRMMFVKEMTRSPSLVLEGLEKSREAEKKEMKKFFDERMHISGRGVLADYLRDFKEHHKTCFESTTQVVDAYFRENKLQDHLNAKLHKKTVVRIFTDAMTTFNSKSSPEDYFTKFAGLYMRTRFCNCSKEQMEKCRKLFQVALVGNGVREKEVVQVASNWGTTAYHKKNGEKSSSEDCAEFAKTWVKDFAPIVKEAFVILKNSIGGGYAESDKNQYKLIQKYLEMRCSDGKFDKEDFVGFLNDSRERVKLIVEYYKARNPRGRLV